MQDQSLIITSNFFLEGYKAKHIHASKQPSKQWKHKVLAINVNSNTYCFNVLKYPWHWMQASWMGKKKNTRKTKLSEGSLKSNPSIFRNLNLDKQEYLLSQTSTCLYWWEKQIYNAICTWNKTYMIVKYAG